MGDLIREYIQGIGDLQSHYARPVGSLKETAPASSAWPETLPPAVLSYHRALGGNPVLEGNESVIITGQQPGIFTGPLYSIYKAITAIKLSEKLSKEHDHPYVPVFWLGTEDHDFEEAASVYYLTKHYMATKLTYSPDALEENLPMHEVPVDARLAELAEEIMNETQGSEYREIIKTHLHETIEAADSLGDWVGRMLSRLFQDTPLVMFAPHIPEARRLSVPIIEKAIREPLECTRLINEAGREMEAKGYPQQVAKSLNECAFFISEGMQRCKVTWENGTFGLPDTKRSFSEEELIGILHEDPERFSPNVALRCIVQQHLFPVEAYVAGPGELAYWGQFKPVFDWYEMPMPVVYPRARGVLTNSKIGSLMKSHGLEYADMSQPETVLTEQALKKVSTHPGREKIKESRATLISAADELTEQLSCMDATAHRMSGKFHDGLQKRLEKIEGVLIRSDEAQLDTVRNQVARLVQTLAPHRKPQERMMSIYSFLGEHGWDLITKIENQLDIESFELNEIEL
jgi:bacillithiol biosynthesis cysteine-adding enzyme BshC